VRRLTGRSEFRSAFLWLHCGLTANFLRVQRAARELMRAHTVCGPANFAAAPQGQ